MWWPLVFIIVLMWIPAGAVSAQDKPKSFTEAVLFSGGTVTSDGLKMPVLGAGIGGGWGERFTIIVDFAYSSLRNYAPGFGSESFSFKGPVSNSRLLTFDANFQVDMIPRSTKPRLVPYVTLGFGQVTSKFAAVPGFFCFAGPCAPPTRTGFSDGSTGFGGGAGLRIPITQSMGVRPELKVWRVGGNQELGLDTGAVVHASAVVQATVGIYFRH
jgi:hypothetical protein